MNIGILTHYDVNNQGAQLQMMAMYRQLQAMGHTSCILTYPKNYDFEPKQKLRNQVGIRSIPYYLKHFLFEKGLGLTLFNVCKFLSNRNCRKNELIFKPYTTDEIDTVIVGSDEVYSIPMGINRMMYGYGLQAEHVISYAPSFGQTDMKLLKQHSCRELIAKGLKSCYALTARDMHTKNMIAELTHTEVPIVCDPVILYDFVNTHTDVKVPKHKYLIIYAYDRNMIDSQEISAVKTYAKKHALLTVSVGTYHKWCDKNIVCNCLEWIEYFRNAEAVVTDTFHGCVLSVITQRPMAVFVRDINTNKLTALLQQFNLGMRQMQGITISEMERIFSQPLDIAALDKKVTDVRNSSMEVLKKMLER